MPTNQRSPVPFTVGEVVEGKYEIVREVGRGTVGVVYEAIQRALRRRVAIKVLLEGTGANVHLASRFEEDARIASAIGHPNIVEIFDLGQSRTGFRFMVTEFLDGATLASMIKRNPRLPIPLATHLIGQILSGLAAAHKHGIVHRDLKPENIFVSSTEERPNFVKIVDFGIAKIVGHRPGTSMIGSSAEGAAGPKEDQAPNTPLYMSPEQALGQAKLVDHRTDIYSAGVLLYEMLCGRRPFQGKTAPQIIGAIVDGKYVQPRELRAEITPALESVIVRALSRQPADRFADAAEMQAAICGNAAAPVTATAPSPAGPAGPAAGARSTFDGRAAEPPNLLVLSESTVAAEAAKARISPSSREYFVPSALPNVEPAVPDNSEQTSVPPLAAVSTSPDDPIKLDMGPTARARARDRGARSVARPEPPRRFPWWVAIAGLAVVGGVVFLALRGRQPSPPAMPAPAPEPTSRSFYLLIDPQDATVEIDHQRVSARELPLDKGAAGPRHIKVSAPGRVTRSMVITPTAGMKVGLYLGRTLPPPSAADPPPSSSEVTQTYPATPRPIDEINDAFAKLDLYASCLSVLGGGTGKQLSYLGSPRPDELALCQQAVEKASTLWPQVPDLDDAAVSFMKAVHQGKSLQALNQIAGRFRTEFLAARMAWQMEELACMEKNEGRDLGFHMRRTALAAFAWARANRSGVAAVDAAKTSLDASIQALATYLRESKKESASASGGEDFLRELRRVSGLARSEKRVAAGAADEACRRLLRAFNASALD